MGGDAFVFSENPHKGSDRGKPAPQAESVQEYTADGSGENFIDRQGQRPTHGCGQGYGKIFHAQNHFTSPTLADSFPGNPGKSTFPPIPYRPLMQKTRIVHRNSY